MMAESVICCEPESERIKGAMNEALNMEVKDTLVSPFGDGSTSDQIIERIMVFGKVIIRI